MTQAFSMKTPLYKMHLNASGEFVDFHGWQLPMHYGSQVNEHHSVRRSAGVFDLSHMTIIDIVGDMAQAWLRTLLTEDVAKLIPSQAIYSCLCNEDGGVLDDLIAYKLSNTKFRLLFNAITRDKVMSWLQTHLKAGVELNLRADVAMLAIQGPEAQTKLFRALDSLHMRLDIGMLQRFYCMEQSDWFISRTGYTGEDGFEIILPNAQAPSLFYALLKQGVQACGLGARDTLRLEAGMCLYGQDLDEQHTPIQSGLDWAVDVSDPDRRFFGRDFLYDQKATGTAVHRVALRLSRGGTLAIGQPVQRAGITIGKVTSGSFSPTLQMSIALARVNRSIIGGCDVIIQDQLFAVEIADLPFIGSN